MPRYLTDHARALQHAQRVRARRAAKATRPEPIADEAPDWTDYAPAEGGRVAPWWTYAEA